MRRPRFTGRAAVLVLVLAVLTVSYASSLRAYLQQRSHIGDLKQQIAKLVTKIVQIAALDRIRDLISFFDRVRHDRGECLGAIPFASALRIAEAGHYREEAVD